MPSAAGEQIWLLASASLEDGSEALGQVVVGFALDDAFARQLRSQTGLEHTLLANGTPTASSFAGGTASWSAGTHSSTNSGPPGLDGTAEFSLDEQPYYVAAIRTIDAAFVDEVALNIADVVATERRLADLMAFSIIAIAVVGSVFGFFLAQRIGRPLTELADAAEVFSTGNLDNSVYVDAKVREVSQLAQALENARVDLQQSVAELRRAKIWTDNLLDSINEGIVTLDNEGSITFFSPGAERITGFSQEEALHKHCDAVFQVADIDERFSRHLPPPDRQVKTVVKLHDGRVATLSLSGAQLVRPETDAAEIALVFRDVSDRTAHCVEGERGDVAV
ncbi:MAG: PAS domain S-box protein [Planctomycetes bacterium]|nr:PAS domain S-box protein [Planctomycetota bacterium]